MTATLEPQDIRSPIRAEDIRIALGIQGSEQCTVTCTSLDDNNPDVLGEFEFVVSTINRFLRLVSAFRACA